MTAQERSALLEAVAIQVVALRVDRASNSTAPVANIAATIIVQTDALIDALRAAEELERSLKGSSFRAFRDVPA